MPKGKREKLGRICNIIRPIANSPGLSERIGYLASEQRRAYNQCIEWLNREPGLNLRKSGGTETPRHRSLQGRISDLRENNPSWSEPPRWVHNAGASLAHRAQRLFADARQDRLYNTRRIEDKRHKWAEKPPQTPKQWRKLKQEERQYARLTRNHRRTLEFRTRKHGTQTLEVDNNKAFSVTNDWMSLWIGSERHKGFRIPLRRPIPKEARVLSFRLVEKRRGRMGIANRPLTAVEYEVHITVEYPESVPVDKPQNIDDIVGVDVGVKEALATSEGVFYRNDGPHACKCPPPATRDDGRRGRLRHQGRCAFARPRQLQTLIVAKPGGSKRGRRRASRRRRKLERQRRELLRKRTADFNRVFTAHAQDLLDNRRTPVRMVAIEGLKRRQMMASARGGKYAPGKNVNQKAGLNRAMAEAATGRAVDILSWESRKRGISVVAVDPANTSKTCSFCGHISKGKESRKSQARFECVRCGGHGNADTNAAVVIRFRAYQQWVDPEAVLGPLLTGRAEHSSGYSPRQLLLPL